MVEIQDILDKDEKILWKLKNPKKYRNYRKRIIKKHQLNPKLTIKELEKYEDIYILTNKRWIQKNLDFNFKFDISKYPKKVLKRHRDIISVNLDSIKMITIDVTNIGFYVDEEDFNKPVPTYLGVELFKEFDKVMKLLKELIPLELKEDKYGDLYLQRKNFKE
ncbi:MAG: hypothetical protein ACFFAO_19235 [Candidatus Hermodarchaeota archaeon]